MPNEPRTPSEQRLRAAVDSAPSGLLMIDSEGRIVLVNREVERIFGYSRDELVGRPVEMLVPAYARASHPDFRTSFLAHPATRRMGRGRELHGQRKDGSQVPVEIGLTPVVTDEGMFVVSAIVDLTATRKAEARFRVAVESAPCGMLMVDRAGRIVLVNREVERIFGYTRQELLGSSIEQLVPERFRGRHLGARLDAPGTATRQMGTGKDLPGLHKHGHEIRVEIGLTPIDTEEGPYTLSSIVDISARVEAEEQRKHLESQLLQAQKMEAIGTLAGGIAHDFNNILGGILGYAELARQRTQDEALIGDLTEVIRAAGRGRELIGSILRFSRRQEASRIPTDLAAIVGDSVRLLRPTLPATIELVQALEHPTARALADPVAVQQVVLNLATNASQAMGGVGRLTIALEPFYARDHFIRLHPELREGHYVALRVTDNGPGMDESVKARAFEPFFTTKPPGVGSGLGLSSVHGIIRQHEGSVDLESEPGAGTTVKCLFPLIEAPDEVESVSTTLVPTGRGEHIIFLDDEPSLSRLGLRQLTPIGYRVTAWTHAEEVLTHLARESADVIVTDYTMPGMTGVELCRRARELGYTGPVILLTGRAAELDPAECQEAGIHHILAKPVSLAELATELRRALDRTDPAGRG